MKTIYKDCNGENISYGDILRWLDAPPREKYSPKEIHNPLENNLWYATPIVNHYEWSKRAKELYKESGDEYISQKLF